MIWFKQKWSNYHSSSQSKDWARSFILQSRSFAVCTLYFAVYGCAQTSAVNSPIKDSNNNQSQAQYTLVRIGYQKGGIVPIARQRGELARRLATQNVKVEWSGPFDRCASLLQAVMADRTDIGGCGDIPGISAIAAGQPLCIGAIQPPNPASLGSAILVRDDSNIKKPADLVGKKVAVNKGGAGEYLLLKVLEKENIPKDKVERVYLNPAEASPALSQGSVDAWAVWEPYVSTAILERGARRITTTHPAPTYSVLLVGTEAAKKNPAVVKTALVALGKEADWLNQNTPDAARYMVKELKVSEAVAKQATENRGPEQVTFPTSDDLTKLQKTADWLLKEKIIPKRVDIAASVCQLG